MSIMQVQKPGVPFTVTMTVGAGAPVVLWTLPAHARGEIDEIELTDLNGAANNEVVLLDNFNLATTGAGATRDLGHPMVVTALAFLQLPFLEGLKFLHILTAQATLGNMRVTIRGREIL